MSYSRYFRMATPMLTGMPKIATNPNTARIRRSTKWLSPQPRALAARAYWESGRAAAAAAGQAPPPVSVPVGFTAFPGEIFRAPRSWVQKAYPTLAYFYEADRGGHFAAWEEPELFATGIRAAFKPLR